MNRCERCQPLILDHLYGLLDEPDEAFVEEHLRTCAACAAARDEAARVQGLIAKAARSSFPQVHFEPPVTRPAPTAPAPVASPAPAAPGGPGRRIAAWLPWAVAAAVWIAVPGTILPVLSLLNRADSARTDAERSVAQVRPLAEKADAARQAVDEPRARARRELASRTQHLDAVLAKWLATEKNAMAQARKSPVDVLKPASVQPGAPNEFEVVIRDRIAGEYQQLTAEIHEVRDDNKTDAVIYAQPLQPHHFEPQRVHLPAEAWTKVTPQSELYLVITGTDAKTRARSEVQERIRLFGPVYSTMLVTDKPNYRPGETIYFRSLTLDRMTFKPPAREQDLEYQLFEATSRRLLGRVAGGTDLVRVHEGTVEPVLVNGAPVRGVGCGEIPLPENLPDGEYTLLLRERAPLPGDSPTIPVPVTRTIKVRASPVDVYQKHIGFAAASFAPGETVGGWVELKSQGKLVAGAEVQAFATADNMLISPIQAQPTTGPDGRVGLRFALPPQLDRGDVRIQANIAVKANGKVIRETVSDRVPVIGHSVVVEFFPEGGTLVAGVPCRVYFRATTPAGQPVPIRGTVTNGLKTLAQVETLTDPGVEGANRGIGSFIYTPELDTPVWLKLTAPANIRAPVIPPTKRNFPSTLASVGGIPAAVTVRVGYQLPSPTKQGVVMTVLDPVTEPGQPIRVHLRARGMPRNLVVGAYSRGRLADTQRVAVEPNAVAEVALLARPDPRGGVVRVTVFEEPSVDGAPGVKPDLVPVAERLVYRKPGEALRLAYTPAGTNVNGAFAGGTPIQLNVTATDEKGNPAAAILYAAVVNGGVDPGRQDRLLTTHFLIAGEITSPDALEHADFLLTDHPKAGEVLDLVLATQGWRRFVEQTPPGYVHRPTAPSLESARLLVANGQYSVWTEPAALREQRRVQETFWPQYEAARKARDSAQRALDAASADRSAEQRALVLADQVETARAESQARVAAANERARMLNRLRAAAWYGVAGFGLLALLLGVASLTQPAGRLPLGIGTAGALALAGFLIFALSATERTQAATAALTKPAQHEEAPAPAARAGDGPEAAMPAPARTEAGATMMLKDGTGVGETRPPKLGAGVEAMDPHAAGRGNGRNPKRSPTRAPLLPSVPSGGGPMAYGMMTPMAAGGGPGGGAGAGIGGGIGGGYGIAGGMGGYGGVSPMGPFGAPGSQPKRSTLTKPAMPAPTPPGAGSAPAPPAPAAGGPLPSLGPAQGFAPSKLGASSGPMTLSAKPPGGVPEIALPNDPSAGKRMVRSMAAALPEQGPGRAGALGGIPRKSRAGASAKETEVIREQLERARQFTESRAEGLTEQMIELFARRRSVSPEVVKKAVEKTKNSDGWSPGVTDAPAPIAPDEAKAILRVEQSMPRVTPLLVREYAAPRPGAEETSDGSPDTILWQPVIVVPSDGKTTIPFQLGQARGYRVVIAGHTLDGRIGAVRGMIPVTPVPPAEPATPATPAGKASPVPPPTR